MLPAMTNPMAAPVAEMPAEAVPQAQAMPTDPAAAAVLAGQMQMMQGMGASPYGGKGYGKGYKGGAPGGYKGGSSMPATPPPWDPRRPPPGTGRGGIGGNIPAMAVGMAGRGGVAVHVPPSPHMGVSQGRGGAIPGGDKVPPPPGSNYVKNPPGAPGAGPAAGRGGPGRGGPGGRGAPVREHSEVQRHHQPPPPRPGYIPPQLDCAPPVLPYTGSFGKKERTIAEHLARHPHRWLPRELEHVSVHWTKEKAGKLLDAVRPGVAFTQDPENTLPPPAEPANGSGQLINVRALIPLGIAEPPRLHGAEHVLRRFEILAANGWGNPGKPYAHAYGGLTAKKGTDKAHTTALAKLVKEQSGIDLSGVAWTKLVEFNYGGERTPAVFYVPDMSGFKEGGVKAQKCTKDTTEEYEVEETYEEEVEGVGEEGEAKKVQKKRKVKKERVKKNNVVTPNKVTLAMMLDSRPGRHTELDSVELICAADVLDEWFRRDCAHRLVPVLEEKGKKAAEAAAESKKRQEEVNERKRKRTEEVDDVKRRRKEKQESLEARWREADAKLNDQEKELVKTERAEESKGVAEEEENALKEIIERHQKEDQAMAEEIRAKNQPKPGEPKVHITYERDWEKFDLFQVFDRPRAGTHARPEPPHLLHRDYLAQVLLALDDGRSIRQCKDLCSHGGGSAYNYHGAATFEKRVEVPELKEPSPKKSPAKSPAKSPKKSPKKSPTKDAAGDEGEA